jgi:hypothetical protein
MWSLLEVNINTSIENNKRTSIDASIEICLEINVEKTKYMLLSRHQDVGQNHHIKIGKITFENVP